MYYYKATKKQGVGQMVEIAVGFELWLNCWPLATGCWKEWVWVRRVYLTSTFDVWCFLFDILSKTSAVGCSMDLAQCVLTASLLHHSLINVSYS
jgi:hypothetical protein